LTTEDLDRLDAAGVAVDERRVAGLRGPDSTLSGIDFADGSGRACGALLVPVTLHQRSTLAEQLGAAAGTAGPVVADAVEVDATFATGMPGVFAACDLSSQVASVAGAIAAGHLAAATLVGSLLTEAHGLTPAGVD
jgi:thioredoxin reductase